jgi:hypothetical protein
MTESGSPPAPRPPDQARVLRRHFFREMVHNDLVSPRGDTEVGLFQVLAFLSVPGFFFSYSAMVRYVVRARYLPATAREAMLLGDQALLIGFSMLVIAFVTVLEWSSLVPARRDFDALTVLPIERRTLLAAKARAVLAFVCLFALAANSVSMAVFPMVSGGVDEALPLRLWRAFAHAVALASASLSVALAGIGLQGVLLHGFGGRLARFSRAVQVALMFLIVQAAFLLPAFARALRGGASASLLPIPAVWFVGLYQALLGNREALQLSLAGAACAGLIVAAVAALIGYARSLGEPLLAWRPAESVRPAGARLSRRAVHWLLLRKADERAAFWFAIATVLRSQKQRVYVGAFCAVGLAVSGVAVILASAAASGSALDLERALLRASLLLTLFVAVGLRAVFALPAELPANWVFRLADAPDARDRIAGARKAALSLSLVPTALALLPLAAVSHWSVPLVHALYGSAVATLLVEALMFRFQKLPFTCTYVPGAANLRSFWAAYVGAFLVYATLVPAFGAWLVRNPLAVPLVAAAAGAVVVLRRRSEAADAARRPLVFEDEEPAGVLRLDLNS